MRYFRTSLVALLAATASTSFAQLTDDSRSTSIGKPRPSSTSTIKSSRVSAAVPSATVASATPSSTRESSQYYPSNGKSYDDPMLDQESSDENGGGAGKSTAFMGGALGAQIGIIAGIVVLAVALFVGIIIYYFHRRKQWEKEVKRRSALPPNAKLVIDKKTGEVRLADRSSSASQMGLAELEKGGHKFGKIEGEVKPGFFKMLLGRF